MIGRARDRLLAFLAQHVILRRPQRQAEGVVRELTGQALGVFFMDWAIHADGYVQFTVPGFEYPRRDLPAHVRFVGPVARVPRSRALPSWWNELDGSRPVVQVSQGTIANEQPAELTLPTLRALADRDVLVVVTTGGAPLRSRGALPENARAAEYLPYDQLMPKVDAFVTNGGYGGLNYAISHGVPMVVAGNTEDKVETTRRVEWSGAGINLKTARPSETAIAAAVDRVLTVPRFRQRARVLQSEVDASPGVAGIAAMVDELIASAGPGRRVSGSS